MSSPTRRAAEDEMPSGRSACRSVSSHHAERCSLRWSFSLSWSSKRISSSSRRMRQSFFPFPRRRAYLLRCRCPPGRPVSAETEPPRRRTAGLEETTHDARVYVSECVSGGWWGGIVSVPRGLKVLLEEPSINLLYGSCLLRQDEEPERFPIRLQCSSQQL